MFADIFDLPLPSVVQVLETCATYDMVRNNLPDIALPGRQSYGSRDKLRTVGLEWWWCVVYNRTTLYWNQ